MMNINKKCILHIGMHKTGSSSLQTYLYNSFQKLPNDIIYADFKTPNHSGPLLYALLDNPTQDNELLDNSGSTEKINENTDYYKNLLFSNLEKKYTTIIFSAESLVKLSEKELFNFKETLLKYVDKIEVIAYVREPISFMSSAFQQIVKTHEISFESEEYFPRYKDKLEKFETVFNDVEYILFDKKSLHREDVVFDFCKRNSLPELAYKRNNETLSQLAVLFLYTFQRVREKNNNEHYNISLLESVLSEINSSAFRLPATSIEFAFRTQTSDFQWMADRVEHLLYDLQDRKKSTYSCLNTFEITSQERQKLLTLSDNTEFVSYIESQTGIKYSSFIHQNFLISKNEILLNVGLFDGDSIYGWAMDKNNPAAKVTLDLYINGRYLKSIISNNYREDLKGIGVGDGKLAFSFPLSIHCQSNQVNKLDFYHGSTFIETKMITIPNKNGSFVFYNHLLFNEIFIHIPKSAGLSICKAFYGNLGAGHKSLSDYIHEIGGDIGNYFSFAIVRNPWDRFVSAFHFLKKGGLDNTHDFLWQQKLLPYQSPKELLSSTLMAEAFTNCLHFMPQKKLLVDLRGDLGVDYLGYFETLNEDIQNVANLVGKEVNLIKSNTTLHPSYKDEFDKESEAILADVYAEDIDFLGYDFDNSHLPDMKNKSYAHFLYKMMTKTEGMAEFSKFKYLCDSAMSTSIEHTIVEVGAYRGRTATALSIGAKLGSNNQVYSVEPHKSFVGIYGGVFGPEDRKAFYQTMLKTHAYQNVNLVNLSSEDLNDFNENVGLLWIDGDHSYEGVKRDLAVWLPKVVKNGVIIFDDTGVKDDGPYKCVMELLSSKQYKLIDEFDTFMCIKKLNHNL